MANKKAVAMPSAFSGFRVLSENSFLAVKCRLDYYSIYELDMTNKVEKEKVWWTNQTFSIN
jgi:hypothetical protein